MKDDLIDIIKPVNTKFFNSKLNHSKDILFNKINFVEKKLPETKIALLGTGGDLSSFRKYFYSSYYPDEISIADLGDVPKSAANKLPQILKTLLDNNIFTILIGNSVDASAHCVEAISGEKKFSSSMVLQNITRFPDFLQNKYEDIFNLNIMGYQTYLSNPETLNFMSNNFFETLRLGKFRENRKTYELPLRDSNMLSMDIAAVKRAEVPDSKHSGVNGLYAEEICQIAQYAGFSENLKLVHLYSTNRMKKNGRISELFSQIVWHIADGYANRRDELLLNNVNGIKKFLVKFQALSEPLTFYHSHISDRWWMKIAEKSEIFPSVVACNKDDYEVARKGEIPERWMWYQQKLSK